MVLDSDDKCAEASRNNSASPTTNPSGTVSLHPPFIMNIFEHWTRIATQNGSPQHDIDKQPSTDSEFLGWYSIGNHPTEENIKVHKQICEINKSSIMLQLSPQSWKIDLPVKSENEISHVNLPYKSFFVYAINEKLNKLNQLDLLIKQNKDYHEALVDKLNEMIQKQSTNHEALMDKLDGMIQKLDGMSKNQSTNHDALMDKLDKLIEATQPRESPIWAIIINQQWTKHTKKFFGQLFGR
ncbi:uncharacterized protein LOC129580237 isoform X2 [Sitodiplosis mosellana]|uniref:uncharacterized protein LOC129580235 isoform X2 n=1 Tax=Sitodiplosis mosellana TaxID=263140 RepID=UPI002444580E|nr:uncharacterized protein LOC129580235 isoform X2 [Sitodiplosis mosellana]XP_055326448.1 uncharacterized protein LOC129580237 isoform X2 [Sitodiplosis mosellana]